MKIPLTKILADNRLVEWGLKRGFHFSGDIAKTEWDKVLTSLSKKLYSRMGDYTPLEKKLLTALEESEVKENLWTHVRYLVAGCSRRLYPPEVKYYFIDEAQDNGKVQMDWIRDLLPQSDVQGIMLAGDDKQAINIFKGSDPSLFLDFPAERRVSLAKTYRCPSEILKEANRVIIPVKKRSPVAKLTAKKEPGKVIHGTGIESVSSFLIKELKDGRNVLALVRDNFLKKKLERKAADVGLFVVNEEIEQLTFTLKALKHIHDTGKMTDIDMLSILPKNGELGCFKKTAYWYDGIVDMIVSGKIKDDPTMLAAYEEMRFGDGLELSDLGLMGFLPEFEQDVKAWNFPGDKWRLSKADQRAYKNLMKNIGRGYGTLRVLTIHSTKGMEEDNVLVCTDLSYRTKRAELEEPDIERRVWYVALSRSRKNLFIIQLEQHNKRTSLVW
jgi:superfamily I DNA/RNA helicase